MSQRVVCVVAICFAVAAAAFAQIDPTAFQSDTCSGSNSRGEVKSGKVYGAPADPSSGTVITPADFMKLQYKYGSDPAKSPQKIAPHSLAPGEGVLYRVENVDADLFFNCHDSIGIRFTEYPWFNSKSEFNGLLPSAACTTGSMHDAVEAAKTFYTDTVSVWGAKLWHDDFVKGCGGDGGDYAKKALTVVGYLYWDTSFGTPRATLAPIISLSFSDNSGGSGSGGTGGSGGSGGGSGGSGGGTPPGAVSFVLPTELNQGTVAMFPAQTRKFDVSTAVSGFSGDLQLSAISDADPTEFMNVSISPSTIAAPGSGPATVTITTDALTFPRDYNVTLVATTPDQKSYYSSFLVSILCDAPKILGTQQPKSAKISGSNSATLKVSAAGSPPFTYQWYNGMTGMTSFPVKDATGSTLTTKTDGMYWVRVSNACGSTDSEPATVSH